MRKRTKPEVVTCTHYMRVRRVRGDGGHQVPLGGHQLPLGDARRGIVSACHVTNGRRLEELFSSICAGSASTAINSLPDNQLLVDEVSSSLPSGPKTSANSIPLVKSPSDKADHSMQDSGNLAPRGAGVMLKRSVNTTPRLLHAMNRTNHLQLKKQVSKFTSLHNKDHI